MKKNKKTAYYSELKSDVISGKGCILVLTDGRIVETSPVEGYAGNTIETLNTIYEKEPKRVSFVGKDENIKTSKSLNFKL